ncbi:MAG: S-layer homology domain-containing protein [Clostridia bacterium]|nr:S-layer homology domain-containing protein [Clostridia bacterium]
MKRITALVVCGFLSVSSLAVFADTASFPDLPPEHWAYGVVMELVNDGTVQGKGDGSFDPTAMVTRAEFVKMVGKGGGFATYTDVSPDHWGYDYIVSSGVLPDENGAFRPSEPMTREDATEILWQRAGEPMGLAIFEDMTAQTDNPDAAAWAYTYGIMKGDDTGDLRFKDSISRAEAAAIISRARKIIRASQNGFMNGVFEQAAFTTDDKIVDGAMSMELDGYPSDWKEYPYILKDIPNEVYAADFHYLDKIKAKPSETYSFAKEFAPMFVNVLKRYAIRLESEQGIKVRFTFFPSMVYDNNQGYVYRIKCEVLDTGGKSPTYKDVFQEENDAILCEGMVFYADAESDYSFGMGIGGMFGFSDIVYLEKGLS